MKKIIKTLIIFIIISIFIFITLSMYIAEKMDVSQKIGGKLYGGIISTAEFSKISNVYNKYIEMINNGEFQEAYGVLSYEYKNYRDYEYFLKNVVTQNLNLFRITQINKITEYAYLIKLISEDSEIDNLVIFNPDTAKYQIVPDTFLEHREVNQKIKKSKVTYEIIDTINYADRFIVNIKILNQNKKENVEISNIKLIREGARSIKGDKNNILISPLEEKLLTLEFETDIDFPTGVEISRVFLNNKSSRTYTINFK